MKLRHESEEKLSSLKLQIQDQSTKLESYEKLEEEMCNVVMHAAALPGCLFTFIFNYPLNAIFFNYFRYKMY